MARRKKRKPMAAVTLAKAMVDNPHWRPDLEGEKGIPRKVEVTKNVRESTISVLASRKGKDNKPLIEPQQVMAADRFRAYWEATGGVGARAIDYSREYVDGGRIAEPIDEAQMNAAKRLNAARAEIGARAFDLLVAVCGQGLGMLDLFESKRDRLTATDNLRNALDDLSRIWGLQVTAGSKPRRRYAGNKKAEQMLYMARKDRRVQRIRKQ
jgi:hypothetical protein